jgi:hypothetical protein
MTSQKKSTRPQPQLSQLITVYCMQHVTRIGVDLNVLSIATRLETKQTLYTTTF